MSLNSFLYRSNDLWTDLVTIDSHRDMFFAGSHFIVDGPSLAYHVYHRLLAHKPPTLNVLDATPSYKELGEGFVVFLEELQVHGGMVQRIFFDGYLPLRKRKTRNSRLDQSLKELNVFHTGHLTGFGPSQNSAIPISSYKSRIFKTTRKSPQGFRGLPPSAFLVPAIIEALRNSDYNQRTTLVPGEADAYCAKVAHDVGGIVLTSDADMLVYNLGPKGAVAFLQDVQILREEPVGRQMEGCETLKASIWRPNVIAEKLALPDLRHLAFRISQDPHLTMNEVLRRAKKSPKAIDGFEEFIKEYEVDSLAPDHLTSRHDRLDTTVAQCQYMDPRVSKLSLVCLALPGLSIFTRMFFYSDLNASYDSS